MIIRKSTIVAFNSTKTSSQAFVLADDPNDDGGAEQCRYGIDGQGGLRSGKLGNQIAQQQGDGSAKHGCRQNDPVIGGTKQAAGNVRHGDTDKGNRAGKGRRSSGQQGGNENDKQAQTENGNA